MLSHQRIVSFIFIISIVFSGYSQENAMQNNYSIQSKLIDEKKYQCITETLPSVLQLIPNGKAEIYNPEVNLEKSNFDINQTFSNANWFVADTIYIEKLIPARANCGVKVNKSKLKLELISAQNLTDTAKEAIKKAPKWVRAELENTLSQLIPAKQNVFGKLILDAQDPYIDEVSFCIANSSAVFLASDYCFPQLFLENAVTIYQHDKDLRYVEIIDYGNSATDDDFYSTVKYIKIDKDSNRITIEVPRDIYYWYIVHPKLSDEISTYIFPDIIEYDYTLQNSPHTLNIASPEDGGVFWREFLYTIQDDDPNKPGEKLPKLKEQIADCEIIYNDKSKETSAIKIITKWVNDVMDFNSEYERPHQPVRIYKLHMGRCGEHEDITAAAARACLIPCRGVSSWSTDHVWNEFWDERWWQWEPVNNSMKDNMVYESGWGKKFGSVLARRSDGLLLPVTEAYSVHTCKINVFALDVNNKPIDGAFLLVGMGPQSDLRLDSYATTDAEGKFTLVVGKDNSYWAGMSSSLGNDPSNGVKLLLEKAVEGEEYNFTLKGNKAKQAPNFNKIDTPPDNIEDFKLVFDFEVKGQLANWKNYLDDLQNTFCYGSMSNSSIKFFVTDEPNYEKSTINQRFDACVVQKDVNAFSSEFGVPDDGIWYAFLNNRNTNANFTKVTGRFALYYSELVGVKENIKDLQNHISIYPNPFTTLTKINIEQTERGAISVEVFNQDGQFLKTIAYGCIDAGLHTFIWDGTDYNNNELPTGIYYIKINSSKNISYQKISLIR